MILINADNCGVFANKLIIVLFFVVSSPFLLTTSSPVSPNTLEKTNRNKCPDEEKGYSARDLVMSKPCRAENYLSNDMKYVTIGQLLTKLQTSEHTTVGTH